MARPTLVSEMQALVPGETATLGLHFEMEPGWHTYWRGLNDTGFPIDVTLDLPQGFESQGVQWPAPQRYISPGEILDYVYEEQVTLLLPIDVPASARLGERVTITADANWLVCKEACIPEGRVVSITLPIASPGEDVGPGSGFKKIQEARERLPDPLPEKQRDALIEWQRGVLVIEPRGAFEWAAFYPAEDSVPIASPIEHGRTESGALRLPIDREAPSDADALRGILEIQRGGDQPPVLYRIDMPAPG